MSFVSSIKPALVSGAIVMMISASPVKAIVIGNTGSADQYSALLGGFGSVGQFHTIDGTGASYAASGVAIHDNWVLTAGHVAAGMSSMDFYLGSGGDFNSFAGREGFAATSWVTNPKWSGNLSSGYDIALVHFDSEDPVFTDIAALYQGSSELGKVGTMVGYGMTGNGATGATTFDGLKRAGNNMIDAVYDTPGKRSDPDRILLADFDSGAGSDNSFGGSPDPEFLESMIAPGDSGGGLFIDDSNCSGAPCLAGITSFGWGLKDGDPNSDFGDAGGFTRVSALYDWIMSVISPAVSDGSGGGSNNGKKGGPKATSGTSFAATSVVDVPEPTTLALFGIGLLGLGAMRLRSSRLNSA